ncbi:hypothetical protein [Wenzhouxiangella marina]|uniref:Uncharacterized protein n=1 Tax=Wenzhouxiangella marina TaxID=1579979 RepID=A0A0K0XX27_9GAMM|nr:hypothetical protein [Wenzhouxiangella marina]AKS42220.1 hypothetical protein WM2015_1853 [Wenzhouxiangella marina]MBB6086008.1 hypothetical protein [Wenzhouxiangella marina]
MQQATPRSRRAPAKAAARRFSRLTLVGIAIRDLMALTAMSAGLATGLSLLAQTLPPL